jgi:hypothetical protein
MVVTKTVVSVKRGRGVLIMPRGLEIRFPALVRP